VSATVRQSGVTNTTEPPAVTWQQTFDPTSGEDVFEHLVETSDGGAILAGVIDRNYRNDSAWVVKVESDGTEQWQQTFNPSDGRDLFVDLVATDDGGAILAGATSIGEDDISGWVLKIGSEGTEQWQQMINPTDMSDYFSGIISTSDGGVILAGATEPRENSDEGWVVKLGSDGTEQWQQTINASDGRDRFSRVVGTSDDGAILTGETDPFGEEDSILIAKVDRDGTEQWQQTIKSDNEWDKINAVVNTANDSAILAGVATPNDPHDDYDSAGWVVKVGSDGAEQWQQIINPTDGGDEVTDLVATNDGGAILAGMTAPGDSDDAGWVLKVGDNGSEQWQRIFNPTDWNDGLRELVRTSDGGAILAGWRTADDPASDYDGAGWVLKVGSDGTKQWQQTINPTEELDIFADVAEANDGGAFLAGWTDAGADASSEAGWAVKIDGDEPSPSTPGDEPQPPAIGSGSPPTDPDNDGRYEDVNGDGSGDLLDVRTLFTNRDTPEIQNNSAAFDFNDDGEFNLLDVRTLFERFT
jgi:uncharacterized protein YrzB (UPF0473 family)